RSACPPGGNATIIVMLRVGQVCARDGEASAETSGAASAPWRNPRRCISRSQRTANVSVNLRLGDAALAGEEVEVAAWGGLAGVGGERGAVAARMGRRRLLPGGGAAVELVVADVQMDAARGDIDLDLVAGRNESERPADIALGCHVQDASAVAGPAHAP